MCVTRLTYCLCVREEASLDESGCVKMSSKRSSNGYAAMNGATTRKIVMET